MARRWIWAFILFTGIAAGLRPAQAADGLLDIKRRGAAEAFRAGKFAETAALMREVIAVDDSQYKDHLQLARACDKLNQSDQAATAYHRVLDLVADSTKDNDERIARTEAAARVKALDAFANRIDTALDKLSKELDAVEKDAATANNGPVMERIWRLRGHLFVAADAKNHGFAEVLASPTQVQSSGFNVVTGQKYHVMTKGHWRMGKNPGVECTADGIADPNNRNPVKRGQLVGVVNNTNVIIPLGADMTFTPQNTGMLLLAPNNESTTNPENAGTLFVTIERR